MPVGLPGPAGVSLPRRGDSNREAMREPTLFGRYLSSYSRPVSVYPNLACQCIVATARVLGRYVGRQSRNTIADSQTVLRDSQRC